MSFAPFPWADDGGYTRALVGSASIHLCPPLCCSHVQGGRVVRAKYGVIGTADLVDDLRNWTALFASGRMHKPVRDCAD